MSTRSWVNCPICDEPDMQCETDEEGRKIINCVNLSCGSNGGDIDKSSDHAIAIVDLIISKNYGVGRNDVGEYVAGVLCTSHSDAVKFEDELRILLRKYVTTPGERAKKLVISVERRQDDFMAFLNNDRKRWDCGVTFREAIGNVIQTHGEDFGIDIKKI